MIEQLALLHRAKEEKRRVTLYLTKRCTTREVRGPVSGIAATGAFVSIGVIHIPLEDIEHVELR